MYCYWLKYHVEHIDGIRYFGRDPQLTLCRLFITVIIELFVHGQLDKVTNAGHMHS